MDLKFTEQIKQWLETHEDERDYAVGALYLLKLSGNQIMYKNIISQIDRRHDFVEQTKGTVLLVCISLSN